MLGKINREIDDFTKTIKEPKGCDEMLSYTNSSIYASIKILLFASKTFSIIGRVMLFFIIFLTGIIALTAIGAAAFNMSYLFAVTLFIFILIQVYVMHYKKYLISSIENSKSSMGKAEN